MANENIHKIINWLGDNENNRLEVTNVETGTVINPKLSYEELIAVNGTHMGYLEDLARKGVKTVSLVKKRKNGSSYSNFYCGKFQLTMQNNVAAGGTTSNTPSATQQQPNSHILYDEYPSGLGQPQQPFGLSIAHQLNRSEEKTSRLERELNEQKDKTYEWREKAKQLEQKIENIQTVEKIKEEARVNQQPSEITTMLKGLLENPQAIQAIGGMLASRSSAPAPMQQPAGLNKPSVPDSISPAKKQAIEVILQPSVGDSHVQLSNYVILASSKGKVEFLKELYSLIEKHNLTKNGSDTIN